jgi:hypothetical protein
MKTGGRREAANQEPDFAEGAINKEQKALGRGEMSPSLVSLHVTLRSCRGAITSHTWHEARLTPYRNLQSEAPVSTACSPTFHEGNRKTFRAENVAYHTATPAYPSETPNSNFNRQRFGVGFLSPSTLQARVRHTLCRKPYGEYVRCTCV